MTNTVSHGIYDDHDQQQSPQDDGVVAISEEDFLARVAAFERNEEREAKLAKERMKRMVAAQSRRRRGECKPSVDDYVDERPRRTGASRTTIACQPPHSPVDDAHPLVYPLYEIPFINGKRDSSFYPSSRSTTATLVVGPAPGQITLVPPHPHGSYAREKRVSSGNHLRSSADAGMQSASVNPVPVHKLPNSDHRLQANSHEYERHHRVPHLAATPVYQHPPPRLSSSLAPPSSPASNKDGRYSSSIKYDLRTHSEVSFRSSDPHVQAYYTPPQSTLTANRIAYNNHPSTTVPANPSGRGYHHQQHALNSTTNLPSVHRASNLLHFAPRPHAHVHHRSNHGILNKFTTAPPQQVKPLRA